MAKSMGMAASKEKISCTMVCGKIIRSMATEVSISKEKKELLRKTSRAKKVKRIGVRKKLRMIGQTEMQNRKNCRTLSKRIKKRLRKNNRVRSRIRSFHRRKRSSYWKFINQFTEDLGKKDLNLEKTVSNLINTELTKEVGKQGLKMESE